MRFVAAHDQDPLPPELIEVHQRAGIRLAIGRQAPLHPLRDHREVRYARRGDDGVGDDNAPASLERRLEVPIRLSESRATRFGTSSMPTFS